MTPIIVLGMTRTQRRPVIPYGDLHARRRLRHPDEASCSMVINAQRFYGTTRLIGGFQQKQKKPRGTWLAFLIEPLRNQMRLDHIALLAIHGQFTGADLHSI